jgi:hypothetical protein
LVIHAEEVVPMVRAYANALCIFTDELETISS